jgi:hypothetical protein
VVDDVELEERMRAMHRRAFTLHQAAFELWRDKGDNERAQLALRRAREEREAFENYTTADE